MALNDELEKLKQAEYWLRCAPLTSEHWKASLDHVVEVAENSKDPALHDEAMRVLRDFPVPWSL